MNPIVEANLEKMIGWQPTDMNAVMMYESIGGNAGKYEGHSCAGIHFCVDFETGLIIAFGNSQDLPEPLRTQALDGNIQDIFKVAVHRTTFQKKIVNFSPKQALPYSGIAKANLCAAVDKYNQKYGF